MELKSEETEMKKNKISYIKLEILFVKTINILETRANKLVDYGLKLKRIKEREV